MWAQRLGLALPGLAEAPSSSLTNGEQWPGLGRGGPSAQPRGGGGSSAPVPRTPPRGQEPAKRPLLQCQVSHHVRSHFFWAEGQGDSAACAQPGQDPQPVRSSGAASGRGLQAPFSLLLLQGCGDTPGPSWEETDEAKGPPSQGSEQACWSGHRPHSGTLNASAFRLWTSPASGVKQGS